MRFDKYEWTAIAINGDSGAAQNDVLRVLDIPAETLIKSY